MKLANLIHHEELAPSALSPPLQTNSVSVVTVESPKTMERSFNVPLVTREAKSLPSPPFETSLLKVVAENATSSPSLEETHLENPPVMKLSVPSKSPPLATKNLAPSSPLVVEQEIPLKKEEALLKQEDLPVATEVVPMQEEGEKASAQNDEKKEEMTIPFNEVLDSFKKKGYFDRIKRLVCLELEQHGELDRLKAHVKTHYEDDVKGRVTPEILGVGQQTIFCDALRGEFERFLFSLFLLVSCFLFLPLLLTPFFFSSFFLCFACSD